MSAAPRVTVGLPVRNGGAYLRASLESLLAQEFRDFEIIVSDNASEDETPAILREFAARDSRLRVHRVEVNGGAATNYNRVVALARGRYFRWHASDDLVSPDVLRLCVAELDRHAQAVLAYPRTRLIGPKGEALGEYDDRLDLRFADAPTRLGEVLRLVGECNAVFGLMRIEVLRRTPRIAAFPGADMALLAELSLHGAFHALDGPFFYRRVHDRSSSADKSDAAQFEWYRPGLRRRFFLRACRHHWECVLAVMRSPLTAGAKARALGILAYKMVQWRREFAADFVRLWHAWCPPTRAVR